jgi:glucose/arabinose dehydrogenase
MRHTLLVIAFSILAAPAAAQLRGSDYVTGLTNPVAFVQDPSAPERQFVVEQAGRIRVVRNGALEAPDFLDIRPVVLSGGERGLLGLAFPPDYGATGRFYVNFTNLSGHTVVARFLRSTDDPLRADPASRFDLRWSTGLRIVEQPFSNHNGGNLVFGPDGYLYIGMGDGGSGNDPHHLAQDPSSLLGKMLRIDVSVPDDDEAGFRVPPDNPFLAEPGTRPEIWAFGYRNPWRFSFDDPALGGTGAMIVGDVGQSAFEEIDHEPAGRGGRNYGWRLREGAHDNVTSLPPAFLPLTDPIFEYGRASGQSVTGGFVYRGAALGASMRGRYFFADFVAGRVWSIALTLDGAGEATASDLREHTAELGGGGTLGLISAFGVDLQGELYVASWSRGVIVRILSQQPPAPFLFVDTPSEGAHVHQPFLIAGWALDLAATSGTGIRAIHVWAYPATGAPPQFVGSATMGVNRGDVGALFGAQFTPSGYGLLGRGLLPGTYHLVVYGLVAATGSFDIARVVTVTVASSTQMAIDLPAGGSTVGDSFRVAGWALDTAAASGTGVDTIHVYAYPVGSAAGPTFLGVPKLGGQRRDVGAAFGAQFTFSGYNLGVNGLPTGTWDIVVYVHSSVSGAFDAAQVVRVESLIANR